MNRKDNAEQDPEFKDIGNGQCIAILYVNRIGRGLVNQFTNPHIWKTSY